MCVSPRNRELIEHLGKWAKETVEIENNQKEPKGSEKYIEVMNLVGDKMRISRMIEAFEAIYPAFPSSWTLMEVKQYLEETAVKYNERIREALDKKEEIYSLNNKNHE